MSSSAPGGSGGGREEKDKAQGLTKFMRRASKVLRRGSSSKGSLPAPIEEPSSEPRSPVSPKPSSSSAPPPIAAAIPKPGASAIPSVPAALQQSIKDTKPTYKETNHRLAKTAAASNAIQEEKVRTMFLKYGFKLEPGDWTFPTSGDAERVEKIVRIRIRRTCHRCNIAFGADKVCTSCKHNRCKKCPRYPLKRPGPQKRSVVAVDDAFTGPLDAAYPPLTIRQRAAGKDLVRRDPVQRARRICHKCDTPFDAKSLTCENCNHQRCPECPRDPPKSSKYSDGYPGDAEPTFPLARRELKDILMRVRWQCHTCQTVFKDLEPTCQACGHPRCDECPREPPREETTPLDPAAVQRITDRMRNVDISPQAPAA